MKILLASRVDLFRNPGGDTSHILALQREFSRLGHHTIISTELEPNLYGLDIVVLFNISRIHETFSQLHKCLQYGIPSYIVPIYHPLNEYFFARHGIGGLLAHLSGSPNRFEQLRVASRLTSDFSTWRAAGRQWLVGYERLQQYCLESATGVLCNSNKELHLLLSHFQFDPHNLRFAVVPTGIDPELYEADSSLFRSCLPKENFILSVGRFEALKNQLGIIRALKAGDSRLVLIGRRNPHHRLYMRRLLLEARAIDALILENMPRSLTVSALAAARVHVLASWTETTGMVSMEAAVAGTPIVVSDRSLALEHLPTSAQLCNPAEPSSIREAILNALSIKIDRETRIGLLNRYSWATVSKHMLHTIDVIGNLA